jgi:CheY-like chemotaxis protein
MDGLPIILAFIADLNYTVRVESTAQSLGYEVRFIERVAQIAPPAEPVRELQYAEHLTGPGAVLIDLVTQWKPSLLIFDLGNSAVPWEEWISLLTSVPATRRIPVICFGSHMDTESIKVAKEAGAQTVLARSKFFGDLPDVIKKYARKIDFAELRASCSQPLSSEALRGLEEFNRGAYFEAHESLEMAWMAEDSPGRELYRAVLQVAVAYLQIERGNYNGAAKMFLRMRQWIDPLPDACRGIDIARLRAEAQAVYQAMITLGPEHIADFDRSLFRPISYQSTQS